MGVRRWIYIGAGTAFIVAVLLTAFDQLVVGYGDDSAYLLGKATPAVTWILTLATPFALVDFFAWLRRSYRGTATLWWSTAGVVASFVIGWYLARGWTLEWLVEGDIEVKFGANEFLDVVVGLWGACATSLVAWLTLQSGSQATK